MLQLQLSNLFNFSFLQKYFQSGPEAASYLTIEWTNQHGCGGNEDSDTHKLNCNLVIQYMVQDYAQYGSTQTGVYIKCVCVCVCGGGGGGVRVHACMLVHKFT